MHVWQQDLQSASEMRLSLLCYISFVITWFKYDYYCALRSFIAAEVLRIRAMTGGATDKFEILLVCAKTKSIQMAENL